jgi:hypothetical protein
MSKSYLVEEAFMKSIISNDNSNFLDKLKRNQSIVIKKEPYAIANCQILLNVIFFSVICCVIYILSTTINDDDRNISTCTIR